MVSNKYIITKIRCWPVFKQDPLTERRRVFVSPLISWFDCFWVACLCFHCLWRGHPLYTRTNSSSYSITFVNISFYWRSKLRVLISLYWYFNPLLHEFLFPVYFSDVPQDRLLSSTEYRLIDTLEIFSMIPSYFQFFLLNLLLDHAMQQRVKL